MRKDKPRPDKVIEYVREENEGQPSLKDQVRQLVILTDENATPNGDALKSSEIDELADERGITFDCNIDTGLKNLCKTKAVERFFSQGGRVYVISQRLDEIVLGRWEEVLLNDREAIIDHIQDDDPVDDEGEPKAVTDGTGVTVRSVVAEGLGVVPEGVEAHLRAGELTDQRERLNDAIDAINENEDVEKRDTYGKIVLRHEAYRYQLTEWAVDKIMGDD